MRSRGSNFFMGNTALMSNLSCDSVTAGAFFPQSDSHVPEEKMSQHTCQHMMAPPRKFSHLVMIHSKIRFGFFKALLYSPANPCKPYKNLQACGSAGIGDEIGTSGILPQGPTHHKPKVPIRLPISGQNYPSLHELVSHRSFGPLGYCTSIPEVVVSFPGNLFKGNRLFFVFRKDAFCPLLPPYR